MRSSVTSGSGATNNASAAGVSSNATPSRRSRSVSDFSPTKEKLSNGGSFRGAFAAGSKLSDEWSAIPSNPSFSDLATNSVAVVPLLNSNSDGESRQQPVTHPSRSANLLRNPQTEKSFQSLMAAFLRYNAASEEEQHDMLVHASRQRRDGTNRHSLTQSSSSSSSSLCTSSTTGTLLIPNSQLTRPGDWRYDTTPLVNFDWNSGCQRLQLFDARPHSNRLAYDRIQNPTITAPWSDLIPSRTTMAVVGVLNLRDCQGTEDLLQAEQELQEWAVRYSTVLGTMDDSSFLEEKNDSTLSSTNGSVTNGTRSQDETNNNNNSNSHNHIITRLFVFDSFDESCQGVDLSKSTLGMDLIAFPPSDEQHSHMLDLHLKIVVNDLAVAFFRALEGRIKESDALGKAASKPVSVASGGDGSNVSGGVSVNQSRAGGRAAAAAVSALANLAGGNSHHLSGFGVNSGIVDNSGHGTEDDDSESCASGMGGGSVSTNASPSSSGGVGGGGLVRGMIRNAMNAAATSAANALNTAQTQAFGPSHRLLTPLDEVMDMNSITVKDLEALQKREVGRREKRSADLSLMAGSPLDAYERYNRAAELTKSAHDPLWYAASLEGCAASFIAMADQGGHGVDTYLENNFRMSDEILSIINAELLKSSDTSRRQSATLAAPDKTKTTLPGAVFFLTEEALGIFSKHPKLAPMYAELALRLALYAAEWEDTHRMCRWGFGPHCNAGEMGNPKRYENSSMAKLLHSVEPTLFKEQISKDTWIKCRKVTELLHKAVSTGALDPRTRSDVALTSAKLCLHGISACRIPRAQETSRDMAQAEAPRLRLPRKAAFFTTVSAESMSRCLSKDASQRAANLWIALSQLYSHCGNMYDDSSNYAWVALRLATLHGLAQQVDGLAAEQAYEMLLVLLSEISPDSQIGKPFKADLSKASFFADQQISSNSRHSEAGAGAASTRSAESNDNSTIGHSELDDSMSALTSVKPAASVSVSGRSASMSVQGATGAGGRPVRGGGIFGGTRMSSTVVQQAKWADDAHIAQAILPLVEITDLIKRNIVKGGDDPKLLNVSNVYETLNLMNLSCVRPKVSFEDCALSQQRFIASLLDLRSSMPTTSTVHGIDISAASSRRPENNGASYNNASIIPPPLLVRSASVVKADSQVLLERTKASGYQAKSVGMSMATFFNPYAVKKSATSGVQTTLVAEGEERTVEVVFENRLSVQLDIPSCRLDFDPIGAKRIEAAPLSFVIPPKSKHFCVYFPFIVVPSNLLPIPRNSTSSKSVEGNDDAPQGNIAKVDSFQLLGLRVTCMNRCFPVSFDDATKQETSIAGREIPQFVPNPASMYPLLKNAKKGRAGGGGKTNKGNGASHTVRVESVPAQPTLNVSFITSETPLEDAAIVPVHLSDGEIYTIPPFRLQTDFGASGQGRIERMQLIAAGLPGLAEEVLFDTEGLEAAMKDDENFDDEDNDMDVDDFEELMEEDGLPPLRMKVLTEDLHLGSINDKDKAQEGSVVKFQIAAAHDMGNQLANGGNVRIRFRYRGASPNEVTEIWRRTEVRLRIVRVKGPRISSLSFRPDLSWGSAFSELSHSLAHQRRRIDALPSSESEKHAQRLAALSSKPSVQDVASANDDGHQEDEISILDRVGTDASTNVSGGEAVVLMAVANETNSTIILSNREGRVGGFQGSPMPTIRVTSGVSVKIPVVIQRIERLDESGEVTDIVAELISRTALTWESVVGEGEANKRVRRGRVRIPSRCLREIIEEHGSFASRICKAPITLSIDIGCKEEENDIEIEPGTFVNAVAELKVNDWVPAEAMSRCTLMLEFCCAPKDAGGNRRRMSNEANTRPPYLWCGQLRRTFNGSDCIKQTEDGSCSPVMVHRAKLSFLQTGNYAVSVCVKISMSAPSNSQASQQEGITRKSASEEVWWAPRAETVVVETENH